MFLLENFAFSWPYLSWKDLKLVQTKDHIFFISFFFIAECVDHFYGDSCSSPCGNCLNGRACDKHNGACSNGCKAHFKGPTCDGKNIGNRGCIICLIVMFVVSHPEVVAIMDYHYSLGLPTGIYIWVLWPLSITGILYRTHSDTRHI